MDLATPYHHLIEQILAATGMSDKMVHMHVGMAIYVAVQFVLRDRRASLTALTTVFALEAINETLDRIYSGSWNLPDTAGDFAATMFWPFVLVLLGQYRRRRWARQQAHLAFLQQVALVPARR